MKIDARFRGPPLSGNGGYVCGLLAGHVDGPAEVTLRAPPPLDVEIDVIREGDKVVARLGAQVIAEAVAARVDLEVPPPVDLARAAEAARGYVGFTRHPFPGCFVCGPEHETGLHIFPGPVAGTRVAAAPWTPDASLGDPLRPEFLWAALDCPSWFGHGSFEYSDTCVLGRLAVDITSLPRAGEACVAMGWSLGRDGRKIHCGAAVFGASGELHGRARATWIALK